MKARVSHGKLGGSIVVEKFDQRRKFDPQISQDKAQPEQFSGGVGHTPILRLSRRAGDSVLSHGFPRNEGVTQEDAIPRETLTSMETRNSIGIAKPFK